MLWAYYAGGAGGGWPASGAAGRHPAGHHQPLGALPDPLRDILDAAVEACSEDATTAHVSACSEEAGCSDDEEGSFTDDSACEDEHGCCGGAEASCKDKKLASGQEIYIQVDTCVKGRETLPPGEPSSEALGHVALLTGTSAPRKPLL